MILPIQDRNPESELRKPYVNGRSAPMHNVYIVQFFSFRPSAVGHIVQPRDCCIIEHIFVPTLSVERNNEKIRFPWASNSKFVIFPQIFPCSNYKICPIIPLLFPVSNGDSPVATTFPRSNYRGFFTTGESYCPMYTLCTAPKYCNKSRMSSSYVYLLQYLFKYTLSPEPL